jgi:hypothetical protein
MLAAARPAGAALRAPDSLPPGLGLKTPETPEELDIPISLVEDLLLRRLYLQGSGSLRELGQALKLSFPLLHAIFQRLRQQQLFEINGMDGNDYRFTLSGVGRELAAKRLLLSRYIGPAPVRIASYTAVVRGQRPELALDRSRLAMAFSDLVLTPRFLDQLGPALITRKPIFLYGPTGNGKTSVVQRLERLFGDVVVIPYAVEVDGQVIVLYDPAVHEASGGGLAGLDPRWVICRRPCVIVGGELEPRMLELQLEEAAGVYAAPLQMRANNGILVIDDFGRQRIPPEYLLNRWIVPLDRRVDYLTLQYGLKFQIPFEMTVVFSTNLAPQDLADEAFLRRIPNKILVDDVDAESFARIFERVLHDRRLRSGADGAQTLRDLCLRLGGALRACQPADIIEILVAASAFEGRPPEVNEESLGRAAAIYFARPKGG